MARPSLKGDDDTKWNAYYRGTPAIHPPAAIDWFSANQERSTQLALRTLKYLMAWIESLGDNLQELGLDMFKKGQFPSLMMA